MELPLRIFAVDPATGVSGWSLLELTSTNPLRITVLRRGTMEGQKLLRSRKEMAGQFQKQYCVLDALYDEYSKLITEFQPDEVVSEGAFGYVHLSALISLTLAINTLRRAAHHVLGKDIHESPPTISKKAFSGSGNADKVQMRTAYENASFLFDCSNQEEISEHEIDSIAHGTGYIRRDIVGDVVQISALEKKRAKREKQKNKQE